MVYYERNLPHWLPEGKFLFVTWRLHDSLPVATLRALRKNSESASGKKFVHFDKKLDSASYGPVWLKDPQLAKLVADAIRKVVLDKLCLVHAYVVMPNHVHMLLEPHVDLRRITGAIKGRSARLCNQVLRRTGQPFWQEESYDHWVRSEESLEKIRRYIERNPVSAGLAGRPEDWQWSSACQGGSR